MTAQARRLHPLRPMARSRTLARVPLLDRAHAPAGALLNVVLRLGILAMTVDALVNGSDQRYAGKSLGPRDVLISFGFAMVFPLFWEAALSQAAVERVPVVVR